MESDETDSLKNAISISIKMCPKSLFGKENRKDQRNQLQEGDDQAHIADRIIAFSNYKSIGMTEGMIRIQPRVRQIFPK